MKNNSIISLLTHKHVNDDTKNFTIHDFLYAYGSPLDSFMYLKLFWPDFVEFNDMVFFPSKVEDDNDRKFIRETFLHYKNKEQTEKSINIIEVIRFFQHKVWDEITGDMELLIAEQLIEMWRARLEILFPQRSFLFEILPVEITGGELGIRFYEKH